MSEFVIDIETLPLRVALEAEYPRELRQPPSNYKKDDAIAEWYVRDEKSWRENRVKECSLNPRLGRVLCIGMTKDGEDGASVSYAQDEADEARVLREFWYEAGMAGGRVVTWNGTFDLRFIVIRSLVHGVTPTCRPETVRDWFARYRLFPHFDCRAVLNNWQQYEEDEGLGVWSAFLGLPLRNDETAGVSGEDIARLYTEGQHSLIEAYCARDVLDTQRIYQKIAPMFDARWADNNLKLSA